MTARRTAANRSVLFWVQHLLGIGHLQRALRIADALIEQGIAVTVVSGGMPQPLPHHPDVALVQLPPLRARDTSFALLDEAGAPIDDRLRERRRDALLAIVAAVAARCGCSRRISVRASGVPLRTRPADRGGARRPRRPPVICSVRDIVVVRERSAAASRDRR